jgi:hypothetical protein
MSAFDELELSSLNLCFDALLSVAMLSFAVTLDAGLIAGPRSVDIMASDVRYNRLYVPDASQLASSTTVAVFAGVLAPALILVVDACARRSRVDKTIRRLIGYGAGAALVVTACAAMRLTSGSPAPDFLAQCAASSNATRVQDAACTRVVPVATLASFPSTNAALSVFSTTLSSLYLYCHIPMGDGVVSSLLQGAPIIGGLAAALSQVGGARAHASDVAWGVVVGLVVTACIQLRFFGGVARSFYGEDATELAEFLHAHHMAANDEKEAIVQRRSLLTTPAAASSTTSSLPLPLRTLPAFSKFADVSQAVQTQPPTRDPNPVERAKATIRALTTEGVI